MNIEPYHTSHLDALVRLSLRAWDPVFDSLHKTMAPEVYQEFYPSGWQSNQQAAVKDTCAEEGIKVWIGVEAESVVGFVAVKLDLEAKLGEIYMIAVDPDFQRSGVGNALMEFALDRMKEVGISIAMVETGGDPGHAPARRSYEKLFKAVPIARYFKS